MARSVLTHHFRAGRDPEPGHHFVHITMFVYWLDLLLKLYIFFLEILHSQTENREVKYLGKETQIPQTLYLNSFYLF